MKPEPHLTLWPACLDVLAQELPEQQFNTWIKPLSAQASADGSRITLLIANRFKLDWIRAQYAARMLAVLEQLNGEPVQIELALAPRANAASKQLPGMIDAPESTPAQAAAPAQMELGEAGARAPAEAAHRSRLNSALTFDVLVEGSANRMARAAALHVAGAPGKLYNPLFIYGGVGLGKTHLMHAVGNKLLADRPEAKVLYIHAEQFVSDVVKAYQRKTFDEFK